MVQRGVHALGQHHRGALPGNVASQPGDQRLARVVEQGGGGARGIRPGGGTATNARLALRRHREQRDSTGAAGRLDPRPAVVQAHHEVVAEQAAERAGHGGCGHGRWRVVG
jgi:hypothetical protein